MSAADPSSPSALASATTPSAEGTDIMWRYFLWPLGIELILAGVLCVFRVPKYMDATVMESVAAVIVALMIALNVSPGLSVARTNELYFRRRIASGSAGLTAVGGVGLLACFISSTLHNFSRISVWPAVASAALYLMALGITPLLVMEDGLELSRSGDGDT